MNRILSATVGVLSGAALAAGAAPAMAAPAAPAAYPEGKSILKTTGLISDRVPWSAGNRHQLSMSTGDGYATGTVRSYYCPPGATASASWASSKCTLRGTSTIIDSGNFENDRFRSGDIHWVSSTGKSALQSGALRVRSPRGVLSAFYVNQRFATVEGTLRTLRSWVSPEGDVAYNYKPATARIILD